MAMTAGCAAPARTNTTEAASVAATAAPSTRMTEVPATETPAAEVPPPGPTVKPPRLVGFWLRGVNVWRGRGAPETEVIGFVINAPDPAPANPEWLYELLARGEIVATFRSAREAKLVSSRLAELQAPPRNIEWYCATYGLRWSIWQAAPPVQDTYATGTSIIPSIDIDEIGASDAGLRDGATIVQLPPPLKERGITVWRAPNGKANAIRSTRPMDRSLSILLTTADRDAALARLKYVEMLE
ncbi:MAG: hypothetical protein K2X32_14610 [Phycisphaerales bacterium]|nr:hypothetical protein [Phycisphaerales bacterium]